MRKDVNIILVMICILILSAFSGCVTLTQENPATVDPEPLQFSTIENIIQDPPIEEHLAIQSQEKVEPDKELSWSQIMAGLKQAFFDDYSTIRPYINVSECLSFDTFLPIYHKIA